MQTMHPTLLIGPSDWDPRQIPCEDYDLRRAALWRDHESAGGAIIYGDSKNHAALAYFTHFTPKLEAAMALIPRRGEPQMLIGGGVNMLPAAKPLTFITDLAPLRSAAKSAADWARGLEAGTNLVLIGGEAMPNDLRHALDRALGDGVRVKSGDASLETHMRRKSPHELRMLREACAILDVTAAELCRAARSGAGVSDCIVKAEYAALRRGAQDVRSLFSLDGGRTLRPFTVPIAQSHDPLQVYLAVRHNGYWADGFVRVANDELQRKTETVLHNMVAEIKAELPCRRLAQIADAGRGMLRPHPLADGTFGSSIGLSLDEPPFLARDDDTMLEQDAVYSLHAGLIDDSGTGAIVSSMVAVTAQGAEILWPIGPIGERS
jgi:Xaa-Pro aminopeptidase